MAGEELHAKVVAALRVGLQEVADKLPWSAVEPLYAAAIEEVKKSSIILQVDADDDGLKVGACLYDNINDDEIIEPEMGSLTELLLEGTHSKFIADQIEAAERSVKEAYRRFDEMYPNFYEIVPVKEPEVAA